MGLVNLYKLNYTVQAWQDHVLPEINWLSAHILQTPCGKKAARSRLWLTEQLLQPTLGHLFSLYAFQEMMRGMKDG